VNISVILKDHKKRSPANVRLEEVKYATTNRTDEQNNKTRKAMKTPTHTAVVN
jgi:hypothetical protein